MSEPAKPPSPRQVLLGLFILTQIAFLFVANTLGFVQWFPSQQRENPNKLINRVAPKFAEQQGHGWQWADHLENNVRRWVDITGQEQGWSLFAPSISKETAFPAVLLSWEDPHPDYAGFADTVLAFDNVNGFNLCASWQHPPHTRQPSLALANQVRMFSSQNPLELLTLHIADQTRPDAPRPRVDLVLSENEPENLHFYVRLSKCRVRKFEGNVLYFNPQPCSHEDADGLGARLNGRIHELINGYHDMSHSYLKYRLKIWQAANPDQELPRQIILIERFFRLHAPDEPRGWDGPYNVPVLRWVLDPAPKDGLYALEPFDFNQQRFVPITRFR